MGEGKSRKGKCGSVGSLSPTRRHCSTLGGFDGGNAQDGLRSAAEGIGSLAYHLVLAREFTQALEAADQAISLAPEEVWIYTNRAHALMFLGRVEEARGLYERYRGQNARPETPWTAVILKDFAELRQIGLSHPLMEEIEAKFAAGG